MPQSEKVAEYDTHFDSADIYLQLNNVCSFSNRPPLNHSRAPQLIHWNLTGRKAYDLATWAYLCGDFGIFSFLSPDKFTAQDYPSSPLTFSSARPDPAQGGIGNDQA
jgi:hypothetical protein